MLKIVFVALLISFAAGAQKWFLPWTNPRLNRIINGRPAARSQFPHQIRIIASISSTESAICGASIISDRFVLTACHCARDFNSFELGFGSTDFNKPSEIQTSNKKIEHSDYDPTNLNNDIALIEIPKPLKWNRFVSPIALPRYTQVSTTFANQQATVSGFGKTKDSSDSISIKLMYGDVRVINNSECSGFYGTDVVKEFTICTFGWNKNQATCSGDSGGPLITFDKNWGSNILLGVVSFASGEGCESRAPAGFVRVTSYLKWINQNTGIRINA